ncbi:MAG TPA: hypothetical protein DEP35_13115 [Deltaproteobacteria bacterium]|nr:hypothetical protein [Deltaproteobacteria bacterium]
MRVSRGPLVTGKTLPSVLAGVQLRCLFFARLFEDISLLFTIVRFSDAALSMGRARLHARLILLRRTATVLLPFKLLWARPFPFPPWRNTFPPVIRAVARTRRLLLRQRRRRSKADPLP